MIGSLSLGGVRIGDVTELKLHVANDRVFPAAMSMASSAITDFNVKVTALQGIMWEHLPGCVRAGRSLLAARVPTTLRPQCFGLWGIERVDVDNPAHRIMMGGSPHQTILRRITWATVHLAQDGKASGEIVMEDSLTELRRHLPIWLAARGRVLITGLGLGCVVRGLLINPLVTHIDVVELDPSIIRIVGAEFAGEPRVTIHLGDALKIHWPRRTRWDVAWHDVIGGQEWTHKEHTQILHIRLMARYQNKVKRQGAWMWPRQYRRVLQRKPGVDMRRFLF